MLRYTLIFWMLLLDLSVGMAQSFGFAHEITVSEDGVMIPDPWTGGLNSAQFGTIDMDGDGVEDLVVLDRSANKASVYLAQGRTYRYSPLHEHLLPDLVSWFVLADYDCDGDKDILGYRINQIGIWENTPVDGIPVFELVREKVSTLSLGLQQDLRIGTSDFPIVKDVDGDGDLDIIKTAAVSQNFLEWHRNYSMERNGVCGSMEFELIAGGWGGMLECASCGSFVFSEEDDCPAALEHVGGSTLLSADVDGDGFLDLVFHEEGCSGAHLFVNKSGNAEETVFLEATKLAVDVPTDDLVFPAVFEEDVTFDGKPDLLFSPFTFGGNLAVDMSSSIRLYAKADDDTYSLATDAFLQDQTLDMGEGAYPLYADVDADGDMDLLIGVGGEVKSGDTSAVGSIVFLENTGTDSLPAYTVADRDWQGFSSAEMRLIKPQLADYDGDGKLDLLFLGFPVDGLVSRLYYVGNTADVGYAFDPDARQQLGITINPQDGFHFVNLDGDPALELLVTRGADNRLRIFEDEGNGSFVEASEVMGFGQNAMQTGANILLYDMRNDGKDDLLAIGFDGVLRIYPDFLDHVDGALPTPLQALLEVNENEPPVGTRLGRGTSPAVYRDQLIIGMAGGGLLRLKNLEAPDFSLPAAGGYALTVYPNPADQYFRIATNGSGTVKVIDLLGKVLYEQESGASSRLRISTEGLAAGAYLIRFEGATGVTTRRLVVR